MDFIAQGSTCPKSPLTFFQILIRKFESLNDGYENDYKDQEWYEGMKIFVLILLWMRNNELIQVVYTVT